MSTSLIELAPAAAAAAISLEVATALIPHAEAHAAGWYGAEVGTYEDSTGMATAAVAVASGAVQLLIGVRPERSGAFTVEGAVVGTGEVLEILGGFTGLTVEAARGRALALVPAGIDWLMAPAPRDPFVPHCGGTWADGREPVSGDRVHYGDACTMSGEWLVNLPADGQIELVAIGELPHRLLFQGRRLSGIYHFRGSRPVLVGQPTFVEE